MYLLDANTLMEAHATFYPVDRIPQFWDWLEEIGNSGKLKMPFEIHQEFYGKYGLHVDWINQDHVKEALILDEAADPHLLQHAIEVGYQGGKSPLADYEYVQIGQDAFLIAYALALPNRTVVTREVSKTTQRRGNTRLPDACDLCGVKWMTDFELYRQLDFNLTSR